MGFSEQHGGRFRPGKCVVATVRQLEGYPRHFVPSKLLLPEPHALKPGIGLLEAPSVIALEDVGDGEHQIERAPVVVHSRVMAVVLKGIGELEQLKFIGVSRPAQRRSEAWS